MLLFTASIEDTPDAYQDGVIGDSFIGYISNITSKLNDSAVTPDKLINLSGVLKLKGDNKIESVTAEQATKSELILHLAADNDNGESTLFKIRWKL